MSLSGFANPRTPRQNDALAFDRANEFRRRLGLAPLSELSSRLGPGGFGSFAQLLLRQQGPGFTLPALPTIPKATAPPSRANDPRISAAARRKRQIAAKRKGRASTILGGSVGDSAVVRSLLG